MLCFPEFGALSRSRVAALRGLCECTGGCSMLLYAFGFNYWKVLGKLHKLTALFMESSVAKGVLVEILGFEPIQASRTLTQSFCSYGEHRGCANTSSPARNRTSTANASLFPLQ
eukprot:342841-Amphidinium_carterae.1